MPNALSQNLETSLQVGKLQISQNLKRSKIILAAVFQAPPMPLGRPSTAADRPPPPSYTSNEKSELEAAYRQADARAQQLGAARAMEQGQNTVG